MAVHLKNAPSQAVFRRAGDAIIVIVELSGTPRKCKYGRGGSVRSGVLMRILVHGALLLATLVALQVFPANAQTTGGNAGGPEAADSEQGAIPAGAMAPPAAPAEATAATRDIGDDAVPSADALATVTRAADGTIREIPPSAALAALLGPGGLADVPNARSAPGGGDAGAAKGLTAVKKTTVFPYRAVGELYVTYGKSNYVCTGTLIGPSTVITLAPCLYGLEGNPVWADDVTFYPGVNNAKAPYEPFKWSNASIMRGYVDPTVRIGSGNVLPYAIGLVTLDKPAGDELGWFGFQTEPNETYDASAISYGSGDTLDNMYTGTCTVAAENMWRSFAFPAPCPANGWGNVLYVTDSDNVYLTGVLVWTYDDGSISESRISPVTYQWLLDNRQ
jgi:V8-like Glu-specific endopeptidase